MTQSGEQTDGTLQKHSCDQGQSTSSRGNQAVTAFWSMASCLLISSRVRVGRASLYWATLGIHERALGPDRPRPSRQLGKLLPFATNRGPSGRSRVAWGSREGHLDQTRL